MYNTSTLGPAGARRPLVRARSLSLRTRLALLILLSVTPALGLVLYTYQEEQGILAAQVQDGALRLARAASADQERLIEGARQVLTGLARLPEVTRGDPAACGALLADLAAQYPFYTSFAVLEPDGAVRCSGGPPADAPGSPNRALLRRVLQTRDFAIGEYRLGAGGLPAIDVGHPILDEAGLVRAAVVAAIDLTWLNELAAKTQLPPGATLTVIDRGGRVLVRYPDPERWIGQRVPEAPIVETILARGEGTAEEPGIDGRPRLYGFTRLRGAPQAADVYVAIGVPKGSAFAEADRILARNLAALALVAAAALAAAWVGGGFFLMRPVDTLVRATERLRAGDLSVRAQVAGGAGELSRLAQGFDEMAEALQQRQAETDRARDALRQQAESLRVLSRRLVEIQEGERRHVARELHDEIGQALTGLRYLLELAARRDPAARSLKEARRAVNDLIAMVRELSLNLRPAMLDDLGLLPALVWHLERYTAQTGVRVAFTHSGLDRRFPPDVETAAYRIVQEALTNVARHAGVRDAAARVGADAETLQLEVADQGRGFDSEAAPGAGSTAGLAGMRERVALLGGRLTVESAPGTGTVVKAELPLGAPGEPRAGG